MRTRPLQPTRTHTLSYIQCEANKMNVPQDHKGRIKTNSVLSIDVSMYLGSLLKLLKSYGTTTLNEDGIGHIEQLGTKSCGRRGTHH